MQGRATPADTGIGKYPTPQTNERRLKVPIFIVRPIASNVHALARSQRGLPEPAIHAYRFHYLRRIVLRIRSQKDFASGLMFVLVGLGFSFVARGYSMGTAAKMGPGYFPFLLGLVLALLGAVVTIGALSSKGEQDQLARWDLKILLWILGSVVLFGLLLKPLGMVLSVFVLVIVSSMASHEFSWKGALLNSVVLVLISMGAFVYGINLQMPVWPAFITG
jgi:Tripartite tricarboxylate transporter TctB family